ncbi:MAG: hypothetical protein AAFO76_10360 [Cyanobacteria bacterium J06607_15]
MKERSPVASWGLPQILAGVMGVGWVMVQTAVPLYWLIERGFDPQPRQFGWQMYTDMAGGERYEIITQGDQTQAINIDRYVHNLRPGLTYGENLLDYLCQKFPNARQTKQLRGDTAPQIYQCPD